MLLMVPRLTLITMIESLYQLCEGSEGCRATSKVPFGEALGSQSLVGNEHWLTCGISYSEQRLSSLGNRNLVMGNVAIRLRAWFLLCPREWRYLQAAHTPKPTRVDVP